ncbi:MAG: arylsulfatase [Bacteroidales bacterium]|nr:arylsulfatase [Bacteroidales bacterium]
MKISFLTKNPGMLMIITLLSILFFTGCNGENHERPNVILIMTDDQGYGDLGYHGNPHIHTPVLDDFAEKSTRFLNFYVSPVCAPTRSSLMTGRYSLRTGVRDTYNGGAIMAADEITIAEMLKNAGYNTGVFGKWHLGDSYPSRSIDQGFDESVNHLSGGMGQVGDFTTYFHYDSSYFNPVLWHNGKKEKYKGYCSDIFTEEAIKFIQENNDQPFFCYLSYNAPHTPLQAPGEYYDIYKDIDPSAGFGDNQLPEMNEKDKEDARKVYAMVSNIDDNLGKLFGSLEKLDLVENTIVIFLTDNGPQQRRYVGGFRGLKGSVYEGGIHVPFFISYPGKFKGNQDIDIAAAHIDVLPTLAELCHANVPGDRIIDGKSLVPAIENNENNLEDRSLFFYWSRKYPEKYKNVALLRNNIKLIGNTDFNSGIEDFELYDLKGRGEYENIISDEEAMAKTLKDELDQTLEELIHEEHMIHQPPIVIGSQYENPVYLNRNDASGEFGIWSQEHIFGYWNVKIMKGTYNLRFKFIEPVPPGGSMLLETSPVFNLVRNEKQTDLIEMKSIIFDDLETKFLPFYRVGHTRYFPFWVEVEKK